MEIQLAYIEKKQTLLNDTDFCKWLRSHSISNEEKVSFIPAMTFFVLGFKDILRHLEYKVPSSEIEMMINEHCKEDSFHWKWFLKDLERLGFNLYSWGNSTTDLFSSIWSDNDIPMREMIYDTIIKINTHNNPKISLIIIEVLEAAFGVFIKNMTYSLSQMPNYKTLEYFGELHLEHEESHSMGHWGDGCQQDEIVHRIELTSHEEKIANTIIDELFTNFEKLFQTWMDSKENYVRMNTSNYQEVSQRI